MFQTQKCFFFLNTKEDLVLHNLLTNLCLFTGQQTDGSDTDKSTDKVKNISAQTANWLLREQDMTKHAFNCSCVPLKLLFKAVLVDNLRLNYLNFEINHKKIHFV